MIERRRYAKRRRESVGRISDRSSQEAKGKRERGRERDGVQRAACAILAHPGVTARSAGRWFANYLNLPKPQPRRPRKPQLPSSWPPLDTRPFPPLLPAIPLFLSPRPPSDYPFPLCLPACLPLPAYLPTYLTLLSSHARPRHCRASPPTPISRI